MLRRRNATRLAAWMNAAVLSNFHFLAQFARVLRRDLEAVTQAITSRWSNGPVEGHVNRLNDQAPDVRTRRLRTSEGSRAALGIRGQLHRECVRSDSSAGRHLGRVTNPGGESKAELRARPALWL
jgi:hypothetical protein